MHHQHGAYGCGVLAIAASVDTGYVGASLAFGGGQRVEVFMERRGAMEPGPRSKRTLGRGSTLRRGGMQSDIPHAKTLLAHPIVERLTLSRYWVIRCLLHGRPLHVHVHVHVTCACACACTCHVHNSTNDSVQCKEVRFHYIRSAPRSLGSLGRHEAEWCRPGQ